MLVRQRVRDGSDWRGERQQLLGRAVESRLRDMAEEKEQQPISFWMTVTRRFDDPGTSHVRAHRENRRTWTEAESSVANTSSVTLRPVSAVWGDEIAGEDQPCKHDLCEGGLATTRNVPW